MLPVASLHAFRRARKTPYFASAQSLHVLTGCLQVACCLHACFPMYKKNAIFCQCAITPCFVWMPPCCLLPPSMFSDAQEKLHIVQSFHVLPGCNHHMYCGLLSHHAEQWTLYFALMQLLHILLGCNNCMPPCLARAQLLHDMPDAITPYGCNHSVFRWGAITPSFAGEQRAPYFARLQGLRALPGCRWNYSMFCQGAIALVLLGCNHSIFF